MKFIEVNLATGQKASFSIFDIAEIREYSGIVNTYKTETNTEFGADHPFRTVSGDPIHVTNGSIIFLRNSGQERVVRECYDRVMELIHTPEPVEAK